MTNQNFAPKRSLNTQALVFGVATGLAQVVTAILYLISARASNVEDYGSVVAAVAAGIATVGLLDLGTNSLWAREMAAGRLDAERLSRLATWKILYVFGIGVLWVVVSGTFFAGSLFWISGLVAFAQVFAQTVHTGLRARGRTELVGAAVIIDKGTAAIVFIMLWLTGVHVLTAFVIGLVVGPLTSGIISNWMLLGPRRLRFVADKPVNPWKGSRNFGVSNAAETARTYDVTLTAVCGGAAAAGTYGAVNRWTTAIELLTYAFSSASAPYMASAPSARAAIRKLRSAIWLPLLAILVSCVVIALAPWAVGLLLGDQYEGSADVLRILAAGTIASNLNQPIYIFLMARGKDRNGAVLLTISTFTMLALVALLTPSLGAIGAALAYVVGQVILLFMLLVAAVRLLAAERAEERVPSAS